MHIYLLTSVYPSQNAPKGTTPVVHYFTKEWVSSGHKVHVFHMESAFPKVYYLFGKIFSNLLYSRLGFAVPKKKPIEYDEAKDGVTVSHISIKKKKPHGRFHNNQIQRTVNIISSYVQNEGVPDCFVGHWDNPQLELLHLLKDRYNRPTCLVYHNNQFKSFYSCYGNDTELLVKDINLVGFRNVTEEVAYDKLFGKPIHSFIAASGVSKPFIEAGVEIEKEFNEVRKFVYVGALINRKYPLTVIESLHQSYQQEPFEMIYIGEGRERKRIQNKYNELRCNGNLTFTGRIPREEVIHYLSQSDVFVMVSKGEIFGLVYLEAMALGCITIAARNEGIDGIIIDGVNGFLCEAGNASELEGIISKIRKMTPADLGRISQKAKETALAYSDVNVAKNYIDELKKIVQ